MALTLIATMPKKKTPTHAFGARLMALRQARGLTQVQLAQVAGTTQRAISYYETVAEYPTVPALVALAEALHVSADELLGLKPPPKAAAPTSPTAPEEKRLWRYFRQVARLPERDQRAVLRLINSVASAGHRKAG